MAINYAHLVMLAEQGIIFRGGARAPCATRSTASRSTRSAQVRYDGTYEDLFFYIERLIDQACGEDIAGRLHTARSRNDMDMTMYRMRQRELIAGARRGDAEAARGAARAGRASHGDAFTARTRTRSRRSRRRSRTTCWRSSSSSNATPSACAPPIESTNQQSARRVRDHRHRVSDRSQSHQRAARLQRPDRQHLRQHRHRRLPARERVGDQRADRRARPRGPGPAAVVHDGVRLPAAERRVRAGQQHHAAEAQPGRARARARDRQQGRRPGAGDRRSPSTTRRSATSSTPRTICSRWSRRCSAMPPRGAVWSRRRCGCADLTWRGWPRGRRTAGSR